jgi:hypothetical protein
MKISTDGKKSEPCDLEAVEEALREIDGKRVEFVIE